MKLASLFIGLLLVLRKEVLTEKNDRLGYISVPGCVEYSPSNVNECIRCQERYYLKPARPKSISDHASCQPCIEGCLDCQDNLKCLKCDSRHTQRPANSTCELCDSNCRTCGSEPQLCLSCPKFSSLDKRNRQCTFTLRFIIIGLALIAFILLAIVIGYSCRNTKGKKKQTTRKNKNITENILDEDTKGDITRNDHTKAQLISSVNMIGVGNNETNLSEVDKETEEPYSNTEDFGGLVRNTLVERRVR